MAGFVAGPWFRLVPVGSGWFRLVPVVGFQRPGFVARPWFRLVPVGSGNGVPEARICRQALVPAGSGSSLVLSSL